MEKLQHELLSNLEDDELIQMEIKELTKEAITSEEILMKVFDCDNDIRREHILFKLTEQAKILKCKTEFSDLVKVYKRELKEYQREQKASRKSKNNTVSFIDNMTEFESNKKYPNLRCGSWIANEMGISTINENGYKKVVCSHPLLLTEIYHDVETNKEKAKLVFKKRDIWREVIVDKVSIANANKIVGLAEFGISVTSENARMIVKYLNDIEQYNEDLIKEISSISRCGWYKGDFIPYSKNITCNSDALHDVLNSIKSSGESEEWYKLVKEIRKSDRFEPKIYLAGAFASILIEPLNALPFIINLWGDTGKGKTVTLMLAVSVWAYPGEEIYVADPKSTVTALELRLDFLKNLPLLMDDLAQIKKKYNGNFSDLVYYLCSGRGKDRSNKNLTLNKIKTWKNCILTNGEHSLVTETMQGGAVNRIIDVEMAEGYIFPNGSEVVDCLKENYGFAGQDFIRAIRKVGIKKVKEIQKDFVRKINEAAKELGVEKEEKQVIPMSLLLTADKIATEYLFEDGIYMDFDTCVGLLKNKGEVSENERAYDFIMSEVAININKFCWDKDYKGEIWGIKEDNFIYIYSNIFNGMCERGNFSRQAFLSWAKKKGLLEHADGTNTKQKSIRGEKPKCICIKTFVGRESEEFTQIGLDVELPFD